MAKEEYADTSHVDDESLGYLHRLIGKTVDRFESPALEVKWPYVLASNPVLASGSMSLFAVENEWKETPGGWDYGHLKVRTADLHQEDNPKSPLSPSAVDMTPLQFTPPVKQINIFERTIASKGSSGPSYSGEHVRYDAAIVFRREDNSAFRLSPEDGPVGRVEFCQMWRDIYNISVRLKRRVMITEDGIDLDPPPA